MKKALVVYGVEGTEGRALFVISALYHCCEYLRDRTVRIIDVDSPEVEVAAEVLAFDTGLRVEICSPGSDSDPDKVFRDAALFASVVYDDASGVNLSRAADRKIPILTATQFPKPNALTAEIVSRLSAAHDPAIFARLLLEALELAGDSIQPDHVDDVWPVEAERFQVVSHRA